MGSLLGKTGDSKSPEAGSIPASPAKGIAWKRSQY